MSAFIIFFITALISFAGSVHIGPVNIMVIKASLRNDFRSAVRISAGGSLPEIIYATVAVGCLGFLGNHPEIIQLLDKMVIPFFLIIGIGYFLESRKDKPADNQQELSFSKGFAAALFNPQLLPFWLGTLLYIKDYQAINSFYEKLAFISGTAIGAFLLLFIYALIARKYRNVINTIISSKLMDQLIGAGMIAMAALKYFS